MLDKSVKNLDVPLRWLVRPALFLAIGVHALVLFTPLPTFKQQPKIAQPDTEVETRLTRLPAPTTQKPPTERLTAQPTASLAQRPPQPNPPSLAQRSVSPDRSQSAPVASPAQPSELSPPPSQPQPSPTPPVPPSANLQVPFADFPDLAGAQAGCFGSSHCRQIEDGTPFRNAAQTLVQQMTAQGYQVTERDDLEDTGQKIYQLVAQNGTTRYLNVLSSDVGSTLYLLAAEPITISDLQQVETIQASLAALLGQGERIANADQVPYPTLFFAGANARPEIDQIRWVAGVTPEQLAKTLTNTLQTNQFFLSAVGSYSGGTMYEVSQKAFIGYLNLVPTADKAGTIVILWKTLPRG